tara:strand:- start:489 stop:674 length:186 start_codon:yes stop_codon:yes gene_type:complete
MKVGDLVKAPDEQHLGVGFVTESLGVHCMVQWSYPDPQEGRLNPGPTLEANSTLEVISEGR